MRIGIYVGALVAAGIAVLPASAWAYSDTLTQREATTTTLMGRQAAGAASTRCQRDVPRDRREQQSDVHGQVDRGEETLVRAGHDLPA